MANSSNDWDLIIEPRGSLFKLNLKEVWKYKDLLEMYIKRDIVTFYKQTILGPLWFFIQPILSTIVYTLIFGKVAEVLCGGQRCRPARTLASGFEFKHPGLEPALRQILQP